MEVRSSLARATLIQMGVRIAVVIVLATVFSYLHIYNSFRTESLVRLERSVVERGQREQALFVQAEDNQSVLQKALQERLLAWRQQEPNPRFDSLFVRLPDGTLRNRPDGFDGTRMPGLFVPKGVPDGVELRRQLLAAYDVVAQYGPAFHVRFQNTYITLPGGAIVIYWPERPTWCQEAEPGFVSSDFEFFTITTPEANPRRKTDWTAIFFDPVAKASMVSVSTPVDVEGRHVATISHDILIEELKVRTLGDRLPGVYNVLFREDGQLIAHSDLKLEGIEQGYNILSDAGQPGASAARVGTAEQRAHLRALFERVKARPTDAVVLELPEYDENLAVQRLEGPDWNFVTVLPERVVSSAARPLLVFGGVSLLLELAIMYWVLRKQIARPLLSFTQATSRLAEGDLRVALETSRGDELGLLARAFQGMVGELRRREEALRQANEGLEHRVEERTRQLKETHRKLVETARQVGRAEIATNVLHNVGNVLNSVHTSALLARERLGRLKLESLQRTMDLVEAHQGDLANFLFQDERGRGVLPFLRKLGKHMQEERKEIDTLLGDVNRHTEHIGAIVKLQQRYARTPQHMVEPVELAELLEDALRINQAALGRHCVEVVRELQPLPPVVTERHKVLMILVNLISNARYAMDAVPEAQRRLTVKLEFAGTNRVRLVVRDNGVGIEPEMLTRIFQHGFTTRHEGHGFGLHSCALAAQELGGSLSVHSAGAGQGATFTLELPAIPDVQAERASA